MLAMPMVNPSTTGHGTNVTARPRPHSPGHHHPAGDDPHQDTASTPKRDTIGTRTTVIAPVGPYTCTFDPPKTAATTPATIAVTSRPPRPPGT